MQRMRAGDLIGATELIQRNLSGRRTPAVTSSVNRPPEAAERTGVLPSIKAPDDAREHVDDAKQLGRFLPSSFSNVAGIRAYKLYIPSNYHGQSCPLIVMLHGCTQSPDDFAAGTRMNRLAEEVTCFVAYPEQPATANPSKCWNWFKRGDQQRDRGEPSLIAGITRQIMQEYTIDAKRIYVAGMSAGGAAAAIMADVYPDLYAGLAVHSGLTCRLAHDIPSAFDAMKNGSGSRSTAPNQPFVYDLPIPTIVFHGDRDSTVHPCNGDNFAVAMSKSSSDTRIATGRVRGGRTYTQTTYTDASGRALFEHWVIHNASHAWSGGSTSGSFTDPKGPDASREILRFFLAHQRPE